MSTYHVFLTDVFGLLQPSLYFNIRNILKGWFDPIAVSAGFTNGAEIFWIPADLAIEDQFLQVHLLPIELSAVAKLTSAGNFDPLASGHLGRTHWEVVNGVEQFLSEVYVTVQDEELISKLIFHECMHNKLRLDGNQLHPQGGLASAILSPMTNLTPQNKNMMSAGLRTPRRQWPNVVPFLVQRRIRRDAGDPLWYI
ncbi:hypothetical protein CN907_19650 [Bacillus anthracis]|nr:hypothetical protein CN907_19650 [Bacillus anthracis]